MVGRAPITSELEKYDHIFDLPDSNPGVRFDQAYNIQTLKPIPEWQQMYEEVKREYPQLVFINAPRTIVFCNNHIYRRKMS